MPNNDDLSREERLRIQNELTKSDLSDRHGAQFGFAGSDELTPEMEKQFLERISNIESGASDTYVSVRSLTSKKAIKVAAAKAKQRKCEDACDELLKAFLTAGVVTEKPEWISFEGWYHFLTKDFLEHTIPPPPPVKVGDTQRHMVGAYYDQVRQDSPDMMFKMAEGLLIDILSVKDEFKSASFFADQVRNGAEIQSRDSAVAKILDWRNKWTDIKPGGFISRGLLRGPDGAMYFTFDCSFTAFAKTSKVTEYDGDGAVQFAHVDKRVEIVGLMMPGFEL